MTARFQVDLVFRDGVNREPLHTDDVREACARARELRAKYPPGTAHVGVTDMDLVDVDRSGALDFEDPEVASGRSV